MWQQVATGMHSTQQFCARQKTLYPPSQRLNLSAFSMLFILGRCSFGRMWIQIWASDMGSDMMKSFPHLPRPPETCTNTSHLFHLRDLYEKMRRFYAQFGARSHNEQGELATCEIPTKQKHQKDQTDGETRKRNHLNHDTDTPCIAYIYTYIGVVWGINVAIYGTWMHMECLGEEGSSNVRMGMP